MAQNFFVVRRLRQDQTDAERALWFRLRDRRPGGLKFRRQVPLDRFAVDFCCEATRLIVETDGGQHAETTARDHEHAKALEAMGYLVLGFWNNDVLQNTGGVVVSILDTLNKQPSDPPHPRPLPNGEREQA